MARHDRFRTHLSGCRCVAGGVVRVNWPIGRYPLAETVERAITSESQAERNLHAAFADMLDRARMKQLVPSALYP